MGWERDLRVGKPTKSAYYRILIYDYRIDLNLH